MSWTQLVPVSRSAHIDTGLQGAIADPLWLLSRQWQLYEFRGADAGTPISVDIECECDPITSIILRGEKGTPAPVIPYEGELLEPLIERETVMTDPAAPPGAQSRAEAGDRFRQLLVEFGFGDYAPETYPPAYRIQAPDEPMEAADRRYFRVMDGHALDGHLIYTAILTALASLLDDAEAMVPRQLAGEVDPSDVRTGVDPDAVVDEMDVDAFPVPEGESVTTEYWAAALAYTRWYVSLVDEPDIGPDDGETQAGDAAGTDGTGESSEGATVESSQGAINRTSHGHGAAWAPNRLEYDAAITTGSGNPFDDEDGTLARFEIWASPGGKLELFDFLPVEDLSELDDDDIASDGDSLQSADVTSAMDESKKEKVTRVGAMPNQITFPGIPSQRWWEFSDATTALADFAADGLALAKLLVLEYAIEYGADWYSLPLRVPAGTYARITECSVTDSFGVANEADYVSDDWRLFRAEPAGHDGPGLLVPPTAPKVDQSGPVEQVTFGRDEVANLAFALERLVEGPTGRAVDRTEFREPDLVVQDVHPADDPDEEYVTFLNPGEDALDVGGLVVYTATRVHPDTMNCIEVHEFATDRTIGPGATLRVYTGETPGFEDTGTDAAVSATGGDDESLWGDVDAVDVAEPAPDAGGDDAEDDYRDDCDNLTRGRLVVRKLLSAPDAEGAYRLATSVPPYWFPFKMTTRESGAGYRLHKAVLLDADSLDAPVSEIPRPKGSILSPAADLLPPGEETLRLYEEEVMRSGREVTRRYRLARSSDGTYHLWSGRNSTVGAGELASGLRFDILDEPE